MELGFSKVDTEAELNDIEEIIPITDVYKINIRTGIYIESSVGII